jgi:hypothetical protein
MELAAFQHNPTFQDMRQIHLGLRDVLVQAGRRGFSFAAISARVGGAYTLSPTTRREIQKQQL